MNTLPVFNKVYKGAYRGFFLPFAWPTPAPERFISSAILLGHVVEIIQSHVFFGSDVYHWPRFVTCQCEPHNEQ